MLLVELVYKDLISSKWYFLNLYIDLKINVNRFSGEIENIECDAKK